MSLNCSAVPSWRVGPTTLDHHPHVAGSFPRVGLAVDGVGCPRALGFEFSINLFF